MKYICLFLLLPFVVNAETFTISGEKDSMLHMIAFQILEKAYQRSGHELDIMHVRFGDSLKLANAGTTDGDAARIWDITKYYPNLVRVPVSLLPVEGMAFSLNKTVWIEHWNDLKDYKIAIVKGAVFIEVATREFDRMMVASFEDAIEKLLSGEVSIIIIPKLAGLNANYFKKYKQIHAVSSTLEHHKLYHYVHRKNTHIIKELPPVLTEMAKNGELKHIQENYFRQQRDTLGF